MKSRFSSLRLKPASARSTPLASSNPRMRLARRVATTLSPGDAGNDESPYERPRPRESTAPRVSDSSRSLSTSRPSSGTRPQAARVGSAVLLATTTPELGLTSGLPSGASADSLMEAPKITPAAAHARRLPPISSISPHFGRAFRGGSATWPLSADSAETRLVPCAGLGGFRLAVLGRGLRLQGVHEPARGAGDVGDGLLEDSDVLPGGLARPADLAHELERRGRG